MSFDDISATTTVYSPLLERLKELQVSQQQRREISREFLSKMIKTPPIDRKYPTCNDLSTYKQNSGTENQMSCQFDRNYTSSPKSSTLGKVLQEISNNSDKSEETEKNVMVAIHNKDITGKENNSLNEGRLLKVDNGDYLQKLPKFTYLKKGQGLVRYNVKQFKGFRKKNGSNHQPQEKVNLERSLLRNKLNSEISLVSLSNSKLGENSANKCLMLSENDCLTPFEKLEELVEQESFSSTSSNVMKLLQEADNSECSTPVSSKVPPISDINLTPIFCTKSKTLNFPTSGLKLLNSNSLKNKAHNFSAIVVNKDLTRIDEQQKASFQENIPTSDSVNNFIQSGILKKYSRDLLGDPSCRSLFTPKVKFLEEGAKVLEYEESESDSNSKVETFCSDDSDLISVSDLESLAQLNFNVQVIHEVSITSNDDSPFKIKDINAFAHPSIKPILNKIGVPIYNKLPENVFSNSNFSRSSEQVVGSNVKHNIHENKFKFRHYQRENYLSSEPSNIIKNVNSAPVDTQSESGTLLDNRESIKPYKLLLLSKVDDLSKEISIFKEKNAKMEKLIKELECEKKKISKRNESDKKINELPAVISRGKVSDVCNKKLVQNPLKDPPKVCESNYIISMKLQKLNENVNYLKVENSNLRKKLQKKQTGGNKCLCKLQTNKIISDKDCVNKVSNAKQGKCAFNPKVLGNSVIKGFSKKNQMSKSPNLRMTQYEGIKQIVSTGNYDMLDPQHLCNETEDFTSDLSAAAAAAAPIEMKIRCEIHNEEVSELPQDNGFSIEMNTNHVHNSPIPDDESNKCLKKDNIPNVENYFSLVADCDGLNSGNYNPSYSNYICNGGNYWRGIVGIENQRKIDVENISNTEDNYKKVNTANRVNTENYIEYRSSKSKSFTKNYETPITKMYCNTTETSHPLSKNCITGNVPVDVHKYNFGIIQGGENLNLSVVDDGSNELELYKSKGNLEGPANLDKINWKSTSSEEMLERHSSLVGKEICNNYHGNDDAANLRENYNEPGLIGVHFLPKDNRNSNHKNNIIEPYSEIAQNKSNLESYKKTNLFTINEETEEEISSKTSPSNEKDSFISSRTSKVPEVKLTAKDLPRDDSPQEMIEHNTLKSVGDSIEIIDVYGEKKDYVDRTEREVNTCGVSVFHYPNGDKKTIYPNKIAYYYCKDLILHTYYNNGKEVIEFSNGQKETYLQDGSCQILFPDNSSKSIYRDGTEIFVSNNGTVTRMTKEGVKTVEFPNGQKEIFDSDQIRRTYPDGTMKILFANGDQKTIYSNGVVRIKDKEGNVVMCKKDL